NGECYAWGYNGHGQLGIGNNTNCSTPTLVPAPNGIPFDFICCGNSHTIAINKQNTCYVWGYNRNGELGLGHTNHCNVPTLLSPPSGVPFRSVACGFDHTIAINQQGDCYTW